MRLGDAVRGRPFQQGSGIGPVDGTVMAGSMSQGPRGPRRTLSSLRHEESLPVLARSSAVQATDQRLQGPRVPGVGNAAQLCVTRMLTLRLVQHGDELTQGPRLTCRHRQPARVDEVRHRPRAGQEIDEAALPGLPEPAPAIRRSDGVTIVPDGVRMAPLGGSLLCQQMRRLRLACGERPSGGYFRL
ncbi:hypothetical protein ACGFX2_35335 [Streptomyces goshikiensis]|uniref:hypothetical protein n=1 Tax=Streptomyces goshikiensis TaxID=1942 RepID=UPI00371BD940